MKATLIAGLVWLRPGWRRRPGRRARRRICTSAAYEAALSTLTRLTERAGGTEHRASGRRIPRVLFGRARSHATKPNRSRDDDPSRSYDEARLPRRVTAPRGHALTVRKRLLPSLIRERFKTARTALEQKNLKEAEPQLVEAKLMIADAGKLAIKDQGLADLSVLVDGFLQLGD